MSYQHDVDDIFGINQPIDESIEQQVQFTPQGWQEVEPFPVVVVVVVVVVDKD